MTVHIVNLVGIFVSSLVLCPLIGMTAERVQHGYSEDGPLALLAAIVFALGVTLAFV